MSFETNQLARYLSMAATKVKRSAERVTLGRVKEGKCLCCDAAAVRRGLCNRHYMQFYRAMNELPKSKRPEFEERHIRDGRILATGHIREIKNPNIFSEDVA